MTSSSRQPQALTSGKTDPAGLTSRFVSILGASSPGRTLLAILGSVLVILILARASNRVAFSYEDPSTLLVGLSLFVLLLLPQRVSVPTWLWWLWGALTLAWSLAPGATFATALWELTYLAAFAAARWRPTFWIAAGWVVSNALFNQLSLNAFDLQQYISGSVHYVGGALALAVVPLSLLYGFRSRTWLTQALWGLAAGGALYGALISGARAVYLPLAIVLIVLTIRVIRDGCIPYKAVLYVLAAASVVIVAAEAVQPYRPMLTALGQKASVERQVNSVGDRSNFAQRLRFLDQTLDIALTHPFGSGVGTYQAVINSYQKYPMVWSASPHNYYVETAATGGWPRLLLLLAMLGIPLWRAWSSKAWPWALAAGGIWATIAFDVTSYYPSLMMFAFLTLGSAHWAGVERSDHEAMPNPRHDRGLRHLRLVVAAVSLSVAVGLSAWWYLPCEGPQCFLQRHLGAEFIANDYFDTASENERAHAFMDLRSLYPESIWVLRMQQRYAEDPATTLALAAEIARRFPLQSPINYLSWAEAALAMGNDREAEYAIRRGLDVFGPDTYPYGEFRMSREIYQQWLDEARAILKAIGSSP